MKKTINQIRVELSNLSLAHAQINSFFWGDFLRAYKERELDYPLSCCYYPTAQLYTNQTEIPITIIICDKIYKDWSNLNDVESDTLKICRDLFNVINMSQTWQLLGRVQSCTVTKFVERGGDEVAGHQMQINFRLRDKSGICDLPIFGYDFDQDFATGCEPVLIFKDGLLIDTVPSGGIYEYFSDVCEDARVRNSDNSYSDVVESGGVLVLPDITVTDSDGSTYTQPSVTNVVCTIPPPCEDATFNINEIEVGTAPSGGSLDLNLIDQNSDEVPFVQIGSDLIVNIGGGSCEKTYLFDFYGGASVGYSLRKLSIWSENAIRVRRSSDNATLDIGFVGEDLDTASLMAFAGSNSAFVTIWYDQSGNGNHARQTVATGQPLIVQNGVLLTKDSLPTVWFFGNTFMNLDVPIVETANTKIGVGHRGVSAGQTGNVVFLGSDFVSGTNASTLANFINFNYWLYGTVGNLFIPSSPSTNTTDRFLLFGADDLTIRQFRKDGVDFGGSPLTLTMYNTINVIGLYSSTVTYGTTGFMNEIIHYPFTQLTDATAIENNINDYYGIY